MTIKTHKIKTTFLPSYIQHGWGNGYIGVPPEHPWFGQNYDNISAIVHGGLTYGQNHKPKEEPDGYWWIGFDTNHCDDTQTNCPESFVDEQILSLAQQANDAKGN